MGSAPSRDSTVVVIGLGYGGASVAKQLDKKGFRVIGINNKPFMLHNVACLRALCDPTSEEQVTVPLNNLLGPRSELVVGNVSAITPDTTSPSGLTVQVGERTIKPSYVVIATGSSYSFPGKLEATTAEGAVRELQAGRASLQRARRVVVVGGGAVGCELAGEIRHFFPDKSVTIVHGGPTLVSGAKALNDKFKTRVQRTMAEVGVQVVLNEKISQEDEARLRAARGGVLEGEHTIRTVTGKTFQSDLTYFCVGARINSELYRAAIPTAVNINGRLEVNENMQVRGFQKVFAIGDCANLDVMMAFVAGLQAAYVANAISRVEDHKSLSPIARAPSAMLVTNGPNKGVAQLPMFGGVVVGDGMTASVKSKGLFSEKYWKEYGAKFPGKKQVAGQQTVRPQHA